MPRAFGPVAGLLIVALVGCTRQPVVESEAPPAEVPIVDPAADPIQRYQQPFDRAATTEVGRDQLLPPDRTVAGKSTAAMREQIERIWPDIKIADSTGKALPCFVSLETELGSIELSLRPDLAPNHARNLMALAQVGYYDGLRFDRIVHQMAEAPDGTRSEIRLVRFGCPAGTGDPGIGHIGYRLRSEFTDTPHEVGTVGYTRDEDPSSGGVRLYIALGPAPALDGSYTVVGKVSKGMDVVEKIAAGKLLTPELDPNRELPERPVTIHKATARTTNP